jgi:hypothetical protein
LKVALGFAGRLTEPLDALRDLVEEARAFAQGCGRTLVIADDLIAAIREVEGSYAAKAPAPFAKPSRGRPRIQSAVPFTAAEPSSGDDAALSPPAPRGLSAGHPRTEDFSLAGHTE